MKGAPAKAEPSLKALARAFPDSPAVQTEVGLLELSKRNRAGGARRLHASAREEPDLRRGAGGHESAGPRGQAHGPGQSAYRRGAPGQTARRCHSDPRRAGRTDRWAIWRPPRRCCSGRSPPIRTTSTRTACSDGSMPRSSGWATRPPQFERLAERQPKSVAAHTIVGHSARHAEPAGRCEEEVRARARSRSARGRRGEQPGLDLRGDGRQPRHRAAAGADRQITAAGRVRRSTTRSAGFTTRRG